MRQDKKSEELFMETPWGKLALVTWGDSAKPPVLLVHGMVDSAATFVPLLNLLPDDYYYVAFDLPGHGLSDPMPCSTLSQIHLVEPLRLVVNHLGWDSFICIAHSIGYVISSFYNTLYPGKISMAVGLDPALVLHYYKAADEPDRFFKNNTAVYFEKHFGRPKKEYTYEEAVISMMQARGYTAEQASLMLSRCLTPAGQGKYRMSWDRNVKKIASLPVPYETLYKTLNTKAPTLIISTSFSNNEKLRTKNTEILKHLQKELNYFSIVNVDGSHNVHFTNPERLVDHIVRFMKAKHSVRSKL